MSVEQSDYVFDEFDEENDGEIDQADLEKKLKRSGVSNISKLDKLISQLYKAIKAANHNIIDLFRIIDNDNSKSISYEEIRNKLIVLEVNVQPALIKEMFEIYDKNKNGISEDEWRDMFSKQLKQEDQIIQQQQKELTFNQKLMVVIDDFCKKRNISRNELFKYMDSDPDGTITFEEFKSLFQQLNIKDITDNDIKNIFNEIDDNNNESIEWNEFLLYINQAQIVNQQIKTIKEIEDKIQKIKMYPKDIDLDLQQGNNQMPLEDKQKVKISMLEKKIERTNAQIQDLKNEINNMQLQLVEKTKQNDSLNKQILDSQQEYIQLKEELQLNNKIDSNTYQLQNEKQQLINKIDIEKAATHTYKNLYEQQQKYSISLKETYDKQKDERDYLEETIKQLQSQSDEKCLIGRLYHQIMIQKYQDQEKNVQYNIILKQTQKLQIDCKNLEQENDKLNQVIYYLNMQRSQKQNEYQNEISQMKLKILPTVNTQKVENMYTQIKEISQINKEKEQTNKKLLQENYDLQARIEGLQFKLDNFKSLDKILSQKQYDSIEKDFIETRLKLNQIKFDECQAKSNLRQAIEKVDYLNRLNIQIQEYKKDLEDQLVEKNKQQQERESFWIRKYKEMQSQILSINQENTNKEKLAQNLKILSQQVEQDDKSQYQPQASQTQIGEIIQSANFQQVQQKTENYSEGVQLQTNQIVIDQRNLQDLQKENQQLKIEIQNLQNDVQHYKKSLKEVQSYSQQQQQDSRFFSSQNDLSSNIQYQQIHKNVLQEEYEKMDYISKQAINAYKALNQDKANTIAKKVQQIEDMKQEYLAEKQKDADTIRRLNQIIHQNSQNLNQGSMSSGSFVLKDGKVITTQSNMGNIGKLLDEKDETIKDLQNQIKQEQNYREEQKEKIKNLLIEVGNLKYEKEILEQQNQHEHLIKEIEKYKKNIKIMKKKHEDQIVAFKSLKEDFLNQTRSMHDKDTELYNKYVKEQNQNSIIQTQLKQSLDKMKQLNKQLESLKQENEQLKVSELQAQTKLQAVQQDYNKQKGVSQQGLDNQDKIKQLNNLVTSLQQENKQLQQIRNEYNKLQQEIINLKIQLANIKKERNLDIIDQNGCLRANKDSLWFQDEQECLQTIKIWCQTNPQFELYEDIKKNSKNGQINRNIFYKVLENNGIMLKEKDKQQIIDKRLVNKDGNIDIIKFYQKLNNQQVSQIQTNIIDKQQAIQQDLSKTSDTQFQQLEEQLKKTVKEKDQLEHQNKIMKQDFVLEQQNWDSKQKSFKEMQDQDILLQNFQLQDLINSLNDRIQIVEKDIKYRDKEIMQINEEKSQLKEDLVASQESSQYYQQNYENLLDSKLTNQELVNEIQMEKDVIIKNMKLKLDDFRKREKQLQNKLIDIEFKSEEYQQQKQVYDDQIKRLTKRIKELQDQKDFLDGLRKKQQLKQKQDIQAQRFSTIKKK